MTRGRTILTSGASQGTRSGRALDAGRGVYPVISLNGVYHSLLSADWYSLVHISHLESLSRYRLRLAVRAARQALLQPLSRAAETSVRQ